MNTLPHQALPQGAVVDRRIEKTVPLITPLALHEELPLSPQLAETVVGGRQAVTDVLNGVDDRLLVVVGPCSVHDAKAALEYAERLRPVAERLSDGLLVVMRVYFEKPRSTLGWKGLINDPGLDGSGDVNTGLRTARALLLEVLARVCRWVASSSTRSLRSTSPTPSGGAPSARGPSRARCTGSCRPGCLCRSA